MAVNAIRYAKLDAPSLAGNDRVTVSLSLPPQSNLKSVRYLSKELNFLNNQLPVLVSLFKRAKFCYSRTLAEETLFSAILPTPPTHPTLALCSAKLVEIVRVLLSV